MLSQANYKNPMNEAETRAEYIDPALKAAGWGAVEGSRIRREYPITLGRIESQGRRGKPLTADYVLEYRNTKLAVVEAKAWNEALTLPSECVALSWAGLEDFISPRGRRGGGNVGIGFIDFQGLWEGRETALSFSSLSMNRHFHGLPRSA